MHTQLSSEGTQKKKKKKAKMVAAAGVREVRTVGLVSVAMVVEVL